MSFDYFYGQQSDLFTFYRVPKVLFTNERFWNISADAKMLYGILLDRMSLSAKNGWIDKNGRVYIIFTIDEAKMALNCAEQKAIKLLSELEKKAGLIERKRQGLGKPNLIYVKNFISAVDSQLLNCENHNSGTMEITTQELPKSQCNNTDIKNTEFSDTDSIFPSGNGGMMDENDRYQEYFDYFSDQLSMDLLKKDYPYDCRMQNIDEKVLYERAKLILSIYREVCWSTIDRANDVCDTLICTYGDSLDGALIYLENFAPDEARERFEERIRSLFETKWIIELVDMAMLKIREYPDKGALYCEIISKAYLNRFKYRESEMLEVLNMERSTYYDRKKEAILLFGLSLWGTAIPKLKDFLESAREEEALCYCEC